MNSKIPKQLNSTEFIDEDISESLEDKIGEIIQNVLSLKLLEIYPVGSMYITTADTDPSVLFGGTWVKISAGYALWGSTSGASETIPAGVPNIKGAWSVETNASSAKSLIYGATKTIISGSGGWSAGYKDSSELGRHLFNAASGECGTSTDSSLPSTFTNNVYGKSTTVQPPAYKVYAWRRTA